MITDLVVENFRLFKRMEIPDLSKVNLFVGLNNSGKSALLEAILLYASNVSPLVLIDLISKRQETWLNDSNTAHSQATSPLRHVFYDHKIPPVGEGIIISHSLQLHPPPDPLPSRYHYWAIECAKQSTPYRNRRVSP